MVTVEQERSPVAAPALIVPEVGTELRKFQPSDAAIAELAAKYMPLTIAGINDKAGFSRVHEARMMVKGYRIEIDKTRKLLKADALKYGQAVDAEARRLTALLSPVEEHLTAEEDRIQTEKDAIKNAERIKRETEEKARREVEEAAMRAEQERLASERKKLEAERLHLEAERAKVEAEHRAAQEKIDADKRAIEAEQRRFADIETARKHAEELAAAKVEADRRAAEAAEKASKETEERLAREAAAKTDAEKREAEAAEDRRIKMEALRPDQEKILAVADAVAAIAVPEVPFSKMIQEILATAARKIKSIADTMQPAENDLF